MCEGEGVGTAWNGWDGLTHAATSRYSSRLCWQRITASELQYGNAHISSAQQKAEEQARISGAYGDEGWSHGPESSPEARPEGPGRLRRQKAVASGPRMPAASGPGGGRRLPRSRRIARSAEVREILRRGKRSGTAHLDVFDSASPVLHSRVGVVVPKHRHNSAERNVVKRRIRELLRLEVLPRLNAAGATVDVMVRAKKSAYGAEYSVLQHELVTWTERQCLRARSS